QKIPFGRTLHCCEFAEFCPQMVTELQEHPLCNDVAKFPADPQRSGTFRDRWLADFFLPDVTPDSRFSTAQELGIAESLVAIYFPEYRYEEHRSVTKRDR